MNHKYDNSERLETVSDKQWREALDELTAYLRWRLKGKTQRGAHSERELGMPALDYYQEEAVVKLIEGDWKWQDRFCLGKQLILCRADLIFKLLLHKISVHCDRHIKRFLVADKSGTEGGAFISIQRAEVANKVRECLLVILGIALSSA